VVGLLDLLDRGRREREALEARTARVPAHRRIGVVLIVLLLLRSPVFHGRSLTVHNPVLQAVGMGRFLAGLGLRSGRGSISAYRRRTRMLIPFVW
jgi:hypothetical protein